MENAEKPFDDRPVERLARWSPLAGLADAWQPVVRSAVAKLGPQLADALHGTPLGHPLHPLLTDVPVGAWTVTAILDAVELAGREDLCAGADAALAIGIAGAAAAATAGWADWSDTDGESKNLGMAHAMLNATALAAYVASLALRRSGRRGSGIGLAMLGYAFVSAAGYLGGELSFGLQLGVKQTSEPRQPSPDFTPVLAADSLANQSMRRAELAGAPILLYRDGDAIYAMSAICTHRGAPLSEGTLKAGCVECPWHGSVFAFAGGAVVRGPATFPLDRYETRVTNGQIEVRDLR